MVLSQMLHTFLAIFLHLVLRVYGGKQELPETGLTVTKLFFFFAASAFWAAAAASCAFSSSVSSSGRPSLRRRARLSSSVHSSHPLVATTQGESHITAHGFAAMSKHRTLGMQHLPKHISDHHTAHHCKLDHLCGCQATVLINHHDVRACTTLNRIIPTAATQDEFEVQGTCWVTMMQRIQAERYDEQSMW